MMKILLACYVVLLVESCYAQVGNYRGCEPSVLQTELAKELSLLENGKFVYILRTDASVQYFYEGHWESRGNRLLFKRGVIEKLPCKVSQVTAVMRSYDLALKQGEIIIEPYYVSQSDTFKILGGEIEVDNKKYIVGNDPTVINNFSPKMNLKIRWLEEFEYSLMLEGKNRVKIFICYAPVGPTRLKKLPFRTLQLSEHNLYDNNNVCLFRFMAN
jgi:hypothetical protein